MVSDARHERKHRLNPVKNVSDVPLIDHGHGDAFAARIGQFAPHIGLEKLGCRLVVVPPGKKAWPFHNHHANEEMFVILEGAGSLRFGLDIFPVRAGDVIACPAGGPETAHQLIASDDGELRYLAISTMLQPEVAEYPDSGKFNVMSGSPPGGSTEKRLLRFIGRKQSEVDYWDGE
jgi:uncharacterized cupin superfamily protein